MLGWPTPSQAATTTTEQAINYEPSIAFVDVARGATAHTTITVRNQTLTDIKFRVGVSDMRAAPGASRALEPVPTGTAARGAGSWLNPAMDAFTLRAGTQQDVDVAIDVPDDAGAGGYYAAVLFTASPVARSPQFDIDSATSVALLLTVAGSLRRDLRVAIEPQQRVRWHGGSERWTIHLRNEGDVHEIVSGRVLVDSLLSGQSSAQIPDGILLPGESRTERVSFDLRSAPDVWTANALIKREGAKAVAADSARVWVIPWWFIVVLVIAVLTIWWRYRVAHRPYLVHEDENELDT